MATTPNVKYRREFLRASAAIATGCAITRFDTLSCLSAADFQKERVFFGVHQYSIKPLFESKAVNLENYAAFAKNALGVQAIEFAAELSEPLLKESGLAERVRQSADALGIKVHALLCSDATKLDAANAGDRKAAVEDHLRWNDVARRLGCAFMRVRAITAGDYQAQLKFASEGIGQLCDRLPKGSPSILIENITGSSRDPDWLKDLVQKIGSDRVGILADFGNFDGDIYAGMEKLLPITKSLCTKSWDFDADGNDTKIDFGRMLRLVKEASFKGCISVEYLGTVTPPVDGIRKTVALVNRFL